MDWIAFRSQSIFEKNLIILGIAISIETLIKKNVVFLTEGGIEWTFNPINEQFAEVVIKCKKKAIKRYYCTGSMDEKSILKMIDCKKQRIQIDKSISFSSQGTKKNIFFTYFL